MNVLSIDLDYIMWPDIYFYNSMLWDRNPTVRWKKMEDAGHINIKRKFDINQGNLMFVYNLFLKVIKKCKSVSFGYEHDAILYELEKEKYKNIDLYHIDHHDDYLNGWYEDESHAYKGYEKEYFFLENQFTLDEGNWIAWLNIQKKLKSFLWIHNPNTKFTLEDGRNRFIYDSMDGEYYMHLRDEISEEISNINFEHVFVCLSPQYIPENHWHYFGMFISACEEMTEQEAIIHIKKYGYMKQLNPIHDKIVNNYT